MAHYSNPKVRARHLGRLTLWRRTEAVSKRQIGKTARRRAKLEALLGLDDCKPILLTPSDAADFLKYDDGAFEKWYDEELEKLAAGLEAGA